MKPFLLGICGGTGSGKTYLTERIAELIRIPSTLISLDNYYKPLTKIEKDIFGHPNFDTPHALYLDHLADDLKCIQQGKAFERLEYTYNNPAVTPRMLQFTPAPLVIVEGIFTFFDPSIRDQFDLKVFIHADEPVKLHRRLKRDWVERGYDAEDVLHKYRHHVYESYQKYIQPFMYQSDIILVNNDEIRKGLDILVSYLKEQIHDQ